VEVAKRIVNLVYALSNLGWFLFLVIGLLVYQDLPSTLIASVMVFPLMAIICLIVNFSLFQKFTVWNK
tara:strand:+ start:401 stop:604 length:204 start_codon:yes stop_codon:yes gene_type:complete